MTLISCNNEELKKQLPKVEDVESDIIRETIFTLAPNQPAQLPIVFVNSTSEEINKYRLDSIKKNRENIIDSLGLEIWLSDQLSIPSKGLLDFYKEYYPDLNLKNFDGLKTKSIKLQEFKDTNNKTVKLTNSFSDMNVNTIGFVEYSRMIFNQSMDSAFFIFQYKGSDCTDSETKFVNVCLNNKRWEIIKKNTNTP